MIKKIISTLFVFLLIANLSAEEIDVYLIGGQSNAAGRGMIENIPNSYQVNKNVLLFYSAYLHGGGKNQTWQPLCQASDTKDRFGIELSLGTRLQQLHPQRKIALIKHALSGSNLWQQWNPGNLRGEQQGIEFKKWVRTVQLGLAQLKAQGYTPIIRGMVWQQGEADARTDAGIVNAQHYGENLKNLIFTIRRTFNVPNMVFAYGEVLPLKAKRFSHRQIIRQAQIDVAENSQSPLSVKGAILVEGDDLQMRRSDFHTPTPNDDVHLGTFGILTLGERFAEIISNALESGSNVK